MYVTDSKQQNNFIQYISPKLQHIGNLGDLTTGGSGKRRETAKTRMIVNLYHPTRFLNPIIKVLASMENKSIATIQFRSTRWTFAESNLRAMRTCMDSSGSIDAAFLA